MLLLLLVAIILISNVNSTRNPNKTTKPTTPGSFGPKLSSSSLSEVTMTSIWPAPVSNSNTNSGTWSQIGGQNVGATGVDCPYTQHGPGNTLEVCQRACNSAGAQVCTDINYNSAIGDCVFRRCSDPLHPVLSPADGYVVWAITRPEVSYYALDPNDFTFFITSPTDDIIASAVARAPAAAFPYGVSNSTSSLPNTLPGVTLSISSVDDTLRFGVDESYSLAVNSSGIFLSSITVFGAFHGLETLYQLIGYNLTDNTYCISDGVIIDNPRFPYRGIMIDTSRHFMSISVIKQVIDMMATVKLNTLSIHLTDDQSWPLFVPSWPLLSQRSAYSNTSHTYYPSDIQSLVAYARLRGIRVLPEFDSPSHFGALNAAYPQFAAVTKSGDLCMVDPSREEVFSFLEDIWSDIAAEFASVDELRIGGDEFQGCWNDCPSVMTWINQTFGPKADIYDAYHYYERRMIDIVRKHNKTTQAWLDIDGFPDKTRNETWNGNYSDVTLNVWTGCYSGSWQDDVSRFTEEGGNVVVSGPFYITEAQPGAPHFTWQDMYAIDLANFTKNTTENIARVKGGELCVWDDAAGTDSGDLSMQITPFIFAISEILWSPQSATSGVAPDESRAHVHRCRLGQRGYATHPIFSFSTWCPHEFEWSQVPVF